MTETIHCDHCGSTWLEDALDPMHDYWSRVNPGSIVPLGQCPDPDCGALCYPPYGYVYDLEQKLRAMHDVLARLIAWADYMGGWEAPVWEDARRLVDHAVDDDESADMQSVEEA